jgi:hypothetical protein
VGRDVRRPMGRWVRGQAGATTCKARGPCRIGQAGVVGDQGAPTRHGGPSQTRGGSHPGIAASAVRLVRLHRPPRGRIPGWQAHRTLRPPHRPTPHSPILGGEGRGSPQRLRGGSSGDGHTPSSVRAQGIRLGLRGCELHECRRVEVAGGHLGSSSRICWRTSDKLCPPDGRATGPNQATRRPGIR